MTLFSRTVTVQVVSTLLCTSLAACGGGGADNGSATAASTVSNIAAPVPVPVQVPVQAPAPAVTTPTTDGGGASKLSPAQDGPTTSTGVPVVETAPSAATPPATSPVIPSVPATVTPSVPVPVTPSVPVKVTPSVPTPVIPSVPSSSTPSTLPTTTPPVSQTTPSNTGDGVFGTYLRPYAANSLWNSRPLNPVFGTFEIPKSSYFPTVASGAYSTGVFLASASDAPMTIVGPGSTATNTVGVADPDSGTNRVITLPRWPAAVLPASGTDGHADIVDPVTNIVHSFWQLKQQNGRWTASMYSWSKLGGTGWGDPSHYYQGARAVGIPASAGLIRKHEIKDGLSAYPHALAMSLTFNGLANGTSNPAYVFPATAADNTAAANTGAIPQGSLLMLPPNFDSSAIVNPDLRKIVETLKLYGAYVVDRNTGTPFVIYVENDAAFNLMPKGWDNTIADQLDKIRASLRQVVSAQSWVDGNGDMIAARNVPQQNVNILSMRGGWYRQSGTGTGDYDAMSRKFSFAATTSKTVYVNANNTGLTPVKWARPQAGSYVNFTVRATGGARLRLQVKSGNTFAHDTWDLADGKTVRILWPENASIILIATSGTSGASTVNAELVPSP